MLKIIVALVVLGVAKGAPNIKKPVPTLDGRIVGGRDTNITEYPYQLSVLYEAIGICGGALISPTWGLTAAHCVDYVESKHIYVRAGSSLEESGGEVIKVSNILLHPDYNENNIDYDLALLEFASAVSIASASPAPLPEADSPIPEGAILSVTGFGDLDPRGKHADVLQVVEVPVVSKEDCQKAFPKFDITERMFCAGLLTIGGKDACQGDSGGPAIVNGVLTGIVSWGVGCAQPEYPGVYTNVAALRTWIQEVTGL